MDQDLAGFVADAIDNKRLLALTAEIVAAHVGSNAVAKEDLPKFVRDVHAAVAATAGGEAEPEHPAPAVPVRRSVQRNHIICLECGAKLKMLRRHLKTEHGLTPRAYRERWGLRADYPMVAPSYAKRRSQIAKDLGLGRTERASTRSASG